MKRNVDCGNRMHAEAAAPRPESALIEFLPDGGNFERILSDQDFAGVPAPEMGRRHFQEALDDQRRRVGLAKTVAPVIIEDLYDDSVGRAVEIVCRTDRRNDGNNLKPRDPTGHLSYPVRCVPFSKSPARRSGRRRTP
ncbi:MAG TPA: hypothetical protein VIG92_01215, partial [Rhodospirillales bacterium]